MKKVAYLSQNDKVRLQESSRFLVVRTRKGISLSEALESEEAKKLFSKFTIRQEIPRANVTILEIKKSVTDPLAVRNRARKLFPGEPGIRFAGRVLTDPSTGQPVLYTENIFIKFKPGVSPTLQKKILKQQELSIKEEVTYSPNAWFVNMPEGSGMEVFETCEKLSHVKEVEYCEPELIRKSGKKKGKIPHIYFRQWHLKETRIGKRTIMASASVRQAHTITMGKGTTIAVIDDGVDIRHVEFKKRGKIVAPRDVSYDSFDPVPKAVDDNHGTCCAGVACASGLFRASGVAPEARLMPIRNVSELGSRDEASAIAWAVDHGADVISCSWGPEDAAWWNTRDRLRGKTHPISALTSDAIHYAVTKGRKGKGCLVVYAAGNGNEDADPDKYISHPEVIAVAACNDRGKRSVYSDYGECIWVSFPSNDFEAKIFQHPAPLTRGIWTTDRCGSAGTRRTRNFADYTDGFGGTSSACPGAAGVCALILSVNPDLLWTEVKQILRLTADPIDLEKGKYNEAGHSIYYGYGRVNARKAVEMAMLLRKKSK